jgi:SnoaL-like domain
LGDCASAFIPVTGVEHIGYEDDSTFPPNTPPTTEAQLRDLAVRYATAADSRDPGGFTKTFFPDATVTVVMGEKSQTISGHEELRAIPERLKWYDRTFHQLGQSSYRVRRGDATGQVYCTANHLRAGVNTVMYIRYEDAYGRDATGEWLIRSRLVVVEWTESHQTSPFNSER